MVVIPQTAKCYRNQGTDSLGHGDTWESGIATVTEKEVCIPNLMQLDQSWLCLICLYTIIQLWIRRCCLARCWKLSLNSQSYKDRVIEKLVLVSQWTDWLAFVMSQQGFCHWDTFFMWRKFYVSLHHNGNHNKTCSKCFAYFDFKKILTAILWMNLLVFTKQPYSQDKFHIILNALLKIMRSE